MPDLSNHLKAVLVLDDLSNNDSIRANRSDCLTLKKFHYRCSVGHDEFRITGSSTGTAIMSLEIKLNSEANLSKFYECMHRNMPHPFSIVFNATYDGQSRIADYLDAMTVYGYVVSVDDVYNAGVMNGEGRGIVDVKMDILISSITYQGRDKNLLLSINTNGIER